MTKVDSQVVEGMRVRAEQCRRLAAALTDKPAAAVLLQMAEEAEADLRRLDTEGNDMPNPLPPAPTA